MSLLLVDGFDHYTSQSEFLTKWNSGGDGGPTIGPTFARTGLGGARAPNSTTPYFRLLAADEHATLIFGMALKRIAALSGVALLLTCCSDNGATSHVTIGLDAAGKIGAYRGTTAGTLLGAEAGASFATPDVWHYLEVKVVLHDTAGSVEVRLDGRPTTPLINLSGIDTKNAGTKTVFDSIKVCSGSPAGNNLYYDDLYLCNGATGFNNTFLGDVRIETLIPTADGATSGMTTSTGTSHFALVDESPPNTTDYVWQNVDGSKDTWVFADAGASAGSVRGVQMTAFAQKNDTTAKSFRPVIRHAGSDTPGTDVALGIGWAYYRRLFEFNPGTLAPWSVGDLNAAEFGVEVRP